MVRVDDAPATVCMCTELYAIITVQLHVSLFLNISILPQKVNIRRRSHVLLYHCIIYCAAVYCIELSMYHYILKCKQRSFTCTVHASHSFHQNYVLHLERFKF